MIIRYKYGNFTVTKIVIMNDNSKVNGKAEIWKPINGYEGLYEISNLARVRTVAHRMRRKSGAMCPVKSKIKTQNKGKNGYKTVALVKNNITKTTAVHRLVAIAFIPNPDCKRCVNHKDGNKHNNSLGNLEWATHSENNKHAFDMGLRSSRRDMNGDIYRIICRLKDNKLTISQISLIAGQSEARVQGITSGTTYKKYA